MRTYSYTARIGRTALVGASLAMLSACGVAVTTAANTTADPEGATTAIALTYGVPEGETLPLVDYDSDNDTWIVTDGTDTVTLDRAPKMDSGDFLAYSDGNSGLWMAVSPSGDLLAGYGAVDLTGSGVASGTVLAPFSVGGYLARRNDGTIPTGGTASYTGGYDGIIQDQGDTRDFVATVTGDAALMADFDLGTVSGAITNRAILGDSSTPMGDLTLEFTSIGGNGTFAGSATGGEINPDGSAPATDSRTTDTVAPAGTTSGATYGGLFGGDNGAEVAVGIHVDHTLSGVDYIETGAFIGTQ